MNVSSGHTDVFTNISVDSVLEEEASVFVQLSDFVTPEISTEQQG